MIQHDQKKIHSITINNEVLDPEKWYRIASSDYLLRGSGYPDLAFNRNFSYQSDEIKDVIREYAEDQTFVENAFKKRWVVPNGVTLDVH
ncbi:hypothetical protein [Pseudalkalibacillus sp. NRS-1564]|uniref:hypothetical protein n=1 Tax=Pseudalkalibacillus sp. NRS-1564 TaxID=3233900 RepID=UPI003D2D9D0F